MVVLVFLRPRCNFSTFQRSALTHAGVLEDGHHFTFAASLTVVLLQSKNLFTSDYTRSSVASTNFKAPYLSAALSQSFAMSRLQSASLIALSLRTESSAHADLFRPSSSAHAAFGVAMSALARSDLAEEESSAWS